MKLRRVCKGLWGRGKCEQNKRELKQFIVILKPKGCFLAIKLSALEH